MVSASVVFALIAVTVLVVIQQVYSNWRSPRNEQPVGFLGTADYLFRHPEVLLQLFGLFLCWMFKSIFRIPK